MFREKEREMNLLAFQEKFPDELACEQFLIAKRWPEGYICELCDSRAYWYVQKLRRFECKGCHHQKSITADTMFHRTRTPLREWFLAIYLMSESKKGISGLELAHHLGMKDERRAYRLQARIREAMSHREEQYVLEGYVELDDAFFGGVRRDGKRGRGAEGKTKVLVAVSVDENDRPQYAKFMVVGDLKQPTLEEKIRQYVEKKTFVVTDGYRGYNILDDHYDHLAVTMDDPGDNQSYLPWVHILISNAKRFVSGTHHAVKNTQAYLNEFAWRFNRRFCNLFERLIVSALHYQPDYIRA